MQRPGGTTPNVREPTPELRALCETLRPEAEERIKALGGDVETFEPEGYKSQVVAGVNYFVKVLVAPQHPSFSHALLRIYKPIPPKEPKLSGVKLVAGDSELSYFGPGDSVAENAGAEERNAHMGEQNRA